MWFVLLTLIMLDTTFCVPCSLLVLLHFPQASHSFLKHGLIIFRCEKPLNGINRKVGGTFPVYVGVSGCCLGDLIMCSAIRYRLMVDTRRAVPNEYSVLYCPMAGCRNIHKANDRYHSLFTMLGMDQWLGTTRLVSTFCLPDVIARDRISQAFPRRISCWK